MKQILIFMCLLMGINSYGTELYAVVTGKNTELMTVEGFIVKKIRKGSVVKVKVHPKDKQVVSVSFEGKSYVSALRNFRVIESLLDEELVLLKKVSLFREKLNTLNESIKEKGQELEESQEKSTRINRWVEVQKDNALSRKYFEVKTKKARASLKELVRKQTLLNLEKTTLIDELKEVRFQLVEEESVLKVIQEKLKPIKAEKGLFDKGFMTIEVVAKFAPVFHNGNIVKYLKKNSRLKVSVDHDSEDWYVVEKGNKKYFIASADVRIKY